MKIMLHVFNFLSFKFHVAPYLCRPKQDVVFEDKSGFKSIRSSRPPRFLEMPIKEHMSIRRAQKKCHLSPAMTAFAMPVMWLLNHKLLITH